LVEVRDWLIPLVATVGFIVGFVRFYVKPAIENKVGSEVASAMEKHLKECPGAKLSRDKLEAIEGWCRSIDGRVEKVGAEVNLRIDSLGANLNRRMDAHFEAHSKSKWG